MCFALHVRREWRECHQQPVNEEQTRRPDHLTANVCGQKDKRRNEVTHRDALEHARNANVREITLQPAWETELDHRAINEKTKRVQEKSQRKDNHRTPQRVEEKLAATLALLEPSRSRERHRHTDDPKEEREDRVRKGPSIPFRVLEWEIGRASCRERV